MGEIILETDIPRDVEYLYYCGTDEKGNINVGRAKMSRGGRKKKEKKN